MKISDDKYYPKYFDSLVNRIDKLIDCLDFSEKYIDLGYATQASAVYSSNIEGNKIDLNSYMNFKLSQELSKPQKEIQEIEDLVSAYEYAQVNKLTEANLLLCHGLFSKTLLIESKQGQYRTEKIGVFDQTGLVYLAIEPEFVPETMEEFFKDLESLVQSALTPAQVFYFASMIHLIFAQIHPFTDGNGRAARLLEKWFLAEKLGPDFWKISSEKYYKEHQTEYYSNINLGVNYYELNYDKCIPFLEMLARGMEHQ
jgi:Fic family protein